MEMGGKQYLFYSCIPEVLNYYTYKEILQDLEVRQIERNIYLILEFLKVSYNLN